MKASITLEGRPKMMLQQTLCCWNKDRSTEMSHGKLAAQKHSEAGREKTKLTHSQARLSGDHNIWSKLYIIIKYNMK